MPKLWLSNSKSDIYKVISNDTRHGRHFMQVAVKDSEPTSSPSQTTYLSKKWAQSPSIPDFKSDNITVVDMVPKQSWTGGKVFAKLPITVFISTIYGKTQNEFLEDYVSQRHSILIELLQHKSFELMATCVECNQSPGTYCCWDCFGSIIWCNPCCVSSHINHPFHCVEMWNGSFFQKSDILQRQLTIHIPHHLDACSTVPNINHTNNISDFNISKGGEESVNQPMDPYAQGSGTHFQSKSKLIIVSSNGIFNWSVHWCHCIRSPDLFAQNLICAKLFPASFKNPQTVFTFEVLDHFRVDALECKLAAMNFMSKIQCITDEAFPSCVPVCCTTDWTHDWFQYEL